MPKTNHLFSDGAKERENMKKILVLPLLGIICFMPAQLLAACNSPVTLSFDGSQDPDDDEFLYTSLSAFNATKSGYTNTGKKTLAVAMDMSVMTSILAVVVVMLS